MKCFVCGAEVKDGSHFCLYCGAKIDEPVWQDADALGAPLDHTQIFSKNVEEPAPREMPAINDAPEIVVEDPAPLMQESAHEPTPEELYAASVAASQAKAAVFWEQPAPEVIPAAPKAAAVAAGTVVAAADQQDIFDDAGRELTKKELKQKAKAEKKQAKQEKKAKQDKPAAGTPSFFGDDVAPIVTTGHWLVTLLLLFFIPFAAGIVAGIISGLIGNTTVTIILTILASLTALIMEFIWAFNKRTNPSKRNFFRACLIFTAIFLVLIIVLAIIFLAVFAPYIEEICDQILNEINAVAFI